MSTHASQVTNLNRFTKTESSQVARDTVLKSRLNLNAIKGEIPLRMGLSIVLIWIGIMKFTSFEANGIQPFVANSPLMSFFYQWFSVQQFSNLLGISELVIAALILARGLSPYVSVWGALGAMAMFLITLSFMFSTPGVFGPVPDGSPMLLSMLGQFLLKDFALLGIAVQLFVSDIKAIKNE